MKEIISRGELDTLASGVGLQVHRECGGYRLVMGGRNVFPDCGVCPVTTKRELLIFLKGMIFGRGK